MLALIIPLSGGDQLPIPPQPPGGIATPPIYYPPSVLPPLFPTNPIAPGGPPLGIWGGAPPYVGGGPMPGFPGHVGGGPIYNRPVDPGYGQGYPLPPHIWGQFPPHVSTGPIYPGGHPGGGPMPGWPPGYVSGQPVPPGYATGQPVPPQGPVQIWPQPPAPDQPEPPGGGHVEVPISGGWTLEYVRGIGWVLVPPPTGANPPGDIGVPPRPQPPDAPPVVGGGPVPPAQPKR